MGKKETKLVERYVTPSDNTRVVVKAMRPPKTVEPAIAKLLPKLDKKEKPEYDNDLYGRSYYLMTNLINNGYTPEQAAAIAGTLADENLIDPHSFMEAEKNNKGVPLTRNGGYGAGIGSWTGVDKKNDLLRSIGKPEGTPIESLSLYDQILMLLADLRGTSKPYYDALRRTNNLEDAAATSYIITGGVGHSKNWNTHPTPTEARALAEVYAKSNDRLFGYSAYHHGSFDRRYAKAQELLDNFNFKTDSIAAANRADSILRAQLDQPLFFRFNNPK